MTTIQFHNSFGGLPIEGHGAYGVKSAPMDFSKPVVLPPPIDLPITDIGAQIASMLVTSANTTKAGAQQLRRSEQAMQKVAQERELAAMRKEAELKLAAGVMGIVGNTVSGVLSIAGAAVGCRCASCSHGGSVPWAC